MTASVFKVILPSEFEATASSALRVLFFGTKETR
jgi:hypothetical protein